MSTGSARSGAAQRSLQQARGMAQRGYNIGIPALQQQLGLVGQGLASGGEPGYVAEAFAGQRTGITEGLAANEAATGRSRPKTGTGILAIPTDYGARLARALVGSRVTQGLGAVEETNKLFGMGMGGVEQAGSSALGAGQAQLSAMSMMPGYNTTAANIAALGSLGGSIYGAFAQPKAQTFPTATDYFTGKGPWTGP